MVYEKDNKIFLLLESLTMADLYGPELSELHGRFAENTVKDKLRLAKHANMQTMKTINEQNDWIVEHFGAMNPSARKELSICSKQLTNLPKNFGVHMKNLTRLDLSKNKLTNLPYTLKFIAKLESLLLNHNCVRNVPIVLTELSCLKVLQLSDNFLETLPDKLGDIACLETLILSSNKLRSLPISLQKLNQLKTLNVSSNLLQEMPPCLGELVSLETVILSSNQLGDLPPSFSQLNRLKTLDLSSNYFKKLPVCVLKGMQNLESLNVSHNKFIKVTTAPASEKLRKLFIREVGTHTKFPLWIFSGCAPRLEVLDLGGTKFRYIDVPDNCPSLGIKSLLLQRCSFYDKFVNDLTARTDRLECLQIGNGWKGERGNAFWTMPIMNLKNPELLTEIDLRATGIPVVCQAIQQTINLVKLDIGQNNISWLCNEICTLKKLKVLLVDDNDLTELPDNIGQIASLKELKANDNNLARLPVSIMDLKDLAYLDLYNNEFSERPTNVEYMDSLLGLDLDQNSFTINDRDLVRITIINEHRPLWY